FIETGYREPKTGESSIGWFFCMMAGGSDRSDSNCDNGVSFLLEVSDTSWLNKVERDQCFEPIARLVALLFNNSELRHELRGRTTTNRPAIIGGDRGRGTNQLSCNCVNRNASRQCF